MDEEFIDQQIKDLAINARTNFESRDYLGAIEDSEQGLNFLREHGDTNNPDHVTYWASLHKYLSISHFKVSGYACSVEAAERGLSFLREQGDTGNTAHVEIWAQLFNSRSFAQGRSGDHEGRIHSAGEGLAFLQEHGDTNNPEHAALWAQLFHSQATGHGNLGNYKGEIYSARKGLAFLKEHGNSENSQHVLTWTKLFDSQAIGQGSSGDHEGRIHSAGQGLAFLQKHGDTENHELIKSWVRLFHTQALGQGDSGNHEGQVYSAGQGLAFLHAHGDTDNAAHVELWAHLLDCQACGQEILENQLELLEITTQGLDFLQAHGDTDNPEHVKFWARLFGFKSTAQANSWNWRSAAKVSKEGLEFLQEYGDTDNPAHVEIWGRLYSSTAVAQMNSGKSVDSLETTLQGLTFLNIHGDSENSQHVEYWAHLFDIHAALQVNSMKQTDVSETTAQALAFLLAHGDDNNSQHVLYWSRLFSSLATAQANSKNITKLMETSRQGLVFLQEHGDTNNPTHIGVWVALFRSRAIGHCYIHSPENAIDALTQAFKLLSTWHSNPELYIQQWELRFYFTIVLDSLLEDGLDQLWNHIEEPEFLPSLAYALPLIYQAVLDQEFRRGDHCFIPNLTRIIERLSQERELFQRTEILRPLFTSWQDFRLENKPSPKRCLPFLQGLLAALPLAHNAGDANDSETHQIVIQTLYNELLVTLDTDLRKELDLPNLEGMLVWFQQSLKHLAQDSGLIDLAELLVALFLTEEFFEQPFAPAGQFIFNSLLPTLAFFPAEYARLNELKTRTPKGLGGLAEDNSVSQDTAKRHARFFGLLRSSLLVSAEQKFEENMDRGQNRDQILLEYLETSFELIAESDNSIPNYLALLPELFRDRAWVEDIAGSGGDSEELEATELYDQLYLEDAEDLQQLLEALPEIQGLYLSMVIKDSQALFVASAGPKLTRIWSVKEPHLEHKITDYVNQILDGVNRLWESSVPLIERLEGEGSEAAKSKFLASALNSPSSTSWFSKILQVFSSASNTQAVADPDEIAADLFKLLELHKLVDLAKESGAKTLLWSPFGPLHAVPPGLFSCPSEGPFFEIFDRIVVVPGAAKRVGKVALARTEVPALLTQPLSKDQTPDETYFSKIRQGLDIPQLQKGGSSGSLTPENVRANQRAAFQVWIAHGQPSRRIHRGSRWEKTFCLGVGTDNGVIEFKEFVRELEGEENLLPPIMSFLCFQGLLAQQALTVEGFARRLLPFTEALIASPFPIQRSLLRMILESEAPNAPSLKPDLNGLGSLPVSLARRLPELAREWPALNGGGEELASFLDRGSLRAFLTSYCTVWDILKERENPVL